MADQVLLSDISNALKEDYEPALQKALFEKSMIEKVLRKNVGVKSITGKDKIIFHQYGRSGGVGSITNGDILPKAGNADYSQSTVPMKWSYGSIHLDDTTMVATKSDENAIVSMLDSEMESVKESMQRLLARQWYSKGNGVICLVNGASSGTTVTVDTPTAGPTATHYFEPGQYIYIEAAGSTAASPSNVRKIVSVDSATQLTVDSAVTIQNNDVVAFAQVNGSTYATSYNLGSTDKEMMGLQGIVDDGTNVALLQGLTRSSNAWFNSTVLENSGINRAISTKLLNDLSRSARKFGDPKLFITTPGISDAYGEVLESDKRFVNELELKGGFTGVLFRNSVIYDDFDAPLNTVFAIDVNSISIEELTPVSWMQEDGNVLFRGGDGTASYRATLRYYANLCALDPRKSARLDDITDTTT